jgi:short-subunit dehydrogenase
VGDSLIADLSNPEATAGALERALGDGPITRLINNVGVVVPADAEHQSLDNLERAWALNGRASLLLMSVISASDVHRDANRAR